MHPTPPTRTATTPGPPRRRTALLCWLLLVCGASPSAAPVDLLGDFPAEPQLRIDPGAHGATIARIDVDAAGRWLVSGSHDKTVRVWRLADGRLARTLRPPLGAGNLGKVYAVAISPDGEAVAVGGWTGGNASGEIAIYIFDRASGALRHRIPGLPNVINHLAYAPDGQRLVATLGGANGIRVYATGDYREIARDADYGDAATGPTSPPTGGW
jgi:dipeptidyl aminopeptidase/acylaminoacyl peptidase